ncbi:MAG: YbaB/EbfC family nucleoid-associated protein [Chloroflexi bacterium]|nr:MAG: YbaB/EbfC family nucleoid-associated protein [Chloroflexota bacterium]
MAKRRGGFGRGGGGGGMPNMGGMMKQIQKMQDDMRLAQEALADETVEVSVGGGAVTVVITGHQRIQSITLNKDMIDTEDEEWVTDLQDMLVAAMNQAVEQSQMMAAERMEEISGGLGNIPGLGDLLGGM